MTGDFAGGRRRAAAARPERSTHRPRGRRMLAEHWAVVDHSACCRSGYLPIPQEHACVRDVRSPHGVVPRYDSAAGYMVVTVIRTRWC
jgi:hypothetical protein